MSLWIASGHDRPDGPADRPLGPASPPAGEPRPASVADTPSAVTLFHPPPLGEPLIDRRLELAEHEITILTGPAGCGKTTLLAQWFHAATGRSARPSWVSIDPRHRALSDIQSLLGGSVRHRFGLPPSVLIEESLGAIDEADRIMFIDDVHLLDQRTIDELLHWLSGLPGPPWQLILAGRTNIQFTTVRAPKRTVRRVGSSQLRLDDDAVAHALHQRLPGLSVDDCAALTSRIDGWAAGIELVAAELAGVPTPARGEIPDGTSTGIADYFEREVLSGLSPSDQDFLMWASVLAEPSADACDQLTGDACSADRLARLATVGAFVAPTEDRDGYAWVPFGRDFLLGRLRMQGPVPEREARQRVLRWLHAHRRYGEVATQAAETGDWYAIIDLVVDAGLEVIGRGRADDLVAWIELLPAETVEAESGVALLAGMATWVSRGDLAGDEIDRWLALASRSRRGRPPCHAESLSAAIDVGQAAFSRLAPRTRRLIAERAIRSRIGPETAWDALAHAAAGVASFLDDEPRAARRSLTRSLTIQSGLDVESRRWVSRVFSPGVLGLLALIEIDGGGEGGRAEALISAAELQTLGSSAGMLGSGFVRLATARSARARGDRMAALTLALDTAQRAPLVATRALGYLDAAGIYCEQGRPDKSATCLRQVDVLLSGAEDQGRLLAKRRRAIERQVQLGRAARRCRVAPLTEREAEVLRLLDSDLSRREIGEALFLSFETVKTYVQRLYQKLGVSSRAAAVATARSWGWLPPALADGEAATDALDLTPIPLVDG